MTYDELVQLVGFYPTVTADQWDAMSTYHKLHQLAKETGVRNKRWLRLAVRQDQAVKASSEKQPAKSSGPSEPFLFGFGCGTAAAILFWIVTVVLR